MSDFASESLWFYVHADGSIDVELDLDWANIGTDCVKLGRFSDWATCLLTMRTNVRFMVETAR